MIELAEFVGTGNLAEIGEEKDVHHWWRHPAVRDDVYDQLASISYQTHCPETWME